MIDFDSGKIALDDFFDDVNKVRLYSTKNTFIKYDDEHGVIKIVREDIESDEDYEKRLYSIKGAIEAAKAMRRQEYLKLKREFGNE